MNKSASALALAAIVAVLPYASAQAPAARGGGRGGANARTGPPPETEPGIAVTDQLTIAKCSGCHAKDDKGNLTRISWIRTTPEGWQEAIKRMVRLNGLTLQPAEARSIVSYLSNSHGLAPEEAKPVMYMTEHRIQDEVIPNESVRSTCNNCHALGRPFQWHRTKTEWSLLADMHSALYPQADSAFRRNGAGRGGAGGGGAEGGAAATVSAQPVSLDITIDYLTKSYGLHTPEWAAWKARMRAPKIAGKWLLSAHIPGKGNYSGEVTITPGATEDEFKTAVRMQPVTGGPAITRSGTGLVYTGYSWRGRSKGTAGAAAPAPDDLSREMREALWIAPDQTSAEGRWFWGEYSEFGVDVKLRRASAEPQLLSLDRSALKTGSAAQRLRIIGNSLPAAIKPADLELGTGVAVKSIVSHTATEIVATVDVAADAVPGKRDLSLGIATLEKAITLYDKVDYIKVTPEASMARLGGDENDVHPRGYQQFEAVGWHRGADGKPRTADDFEIGPVEVSWSLEEFMAVMGDDDKEFVGSLGTDGLFTPNIDGPNPQRKFGRNNYGDVWAAATAKTEKDKDGKPLVGRSYLVVTVPTYIRWDQPEVSK
ncbi:MAG: quinohemoprotein amine dehydrogenase subunit alpha [Candidatus Solibacter sp.]